MRSRIDDAIQRVSKPARYTGGEWNQVVKDHRTAAVTFAFAFPDVYEVGMSHLGLKIIYHLLNRRDDTVCERVFAPWTDMEDLMRANEIPLWSLETRTPVRQFDILGFTLQYEMTFTNVVNMLDLAGIPLFARDRDSRFPLVIGGGPCALNPEPVAEVFDCFLIGDAEEALGEIVDAYRDWKDAGGVGDDPRRAGLFRRLAQIGGCYVPSLYEPRYNADGTLCEVRPTVDWAPARITRRIARNLDLADFPLNPPVPFLDIIHDRAVVELFRGCTRGCRFCQAGMIYRPVRERPRADVAKAAVDLIRNTGYDELSLMSLSSTDYPEILDLVSDLSHRLGKEYVNLSLPSLRVDAFSVGLAERIHEVRRSGLTFAPEAGTQRLRDVINKRVTDEDILETAVAAFKAGWDAMKFYFMIGLPTETATDLEGIARLASSVMAMHRQVAGKRGTAGARRRLRLTVSASSFVPKSHTPFQWEPQDTRDELERKQRLLREMIRKTGAHFDWHDAATSTLEAVLARGDRRLAGVVVEAWKRGARFDSWTDLFKEEAWSEAMREAGIDPAFYAHRPRRDDELFPWDHIDSRVSKTYLLRERDRALSGVTTPDCRTGGCEACGACD